jgi:hypothetical protein
MPPGGRVSTRECDLGVIHLVRCANGIEPFDSFIESYRRHPAGEPHELVLVLKGFDDEASTEPYRRCASELDGRCVRVPDDGFDLGSYIRAARALSYRRLVFLNSFSVILADRWLAMLAAAASEPRIAAVAATGSWGSRASHARYARGLQGPYARVFPGHDATDRVFGELTDGGEQAASRAPEAAPLRVARRVAERVLGFAYLAREVVQFAQFPTPHLRTNGLLIDRARWLRVCRGNPRDKLAVYRLESGRRGITARLRAEGMEVVVVGRDGRSYGSDAWPTSFTYWQGDQENLLIGDNQTRAYQEGDALRRQVLSAYAWGEQAAPATPT